jgi:alkanesulfonate monooxygenase SsuD/methylene tetrahydromethanopterin reductase-like flavin-dependent oxidoreductase (luciferase family)
MKSMSFGVHLPITGFRKKTQIREKIISFAKTAEDLGYELINVHDHFVDSSATPATTWLDPLIALAMASAVTNRIMLGTSVLNIVLRNPVHCAQALASIDTLSSGRLLAAGVGPGSRNDDFDLCGVPFGERWGRFVKALCFLRLILNGEQTVPSNESYKYYGSKKVVVGFKPFQNRYLPIMIGSWGTSHAALKRVAKYGDGWIASALTVTPEQFKERWDMILDYRRSFGLDTDSFKNSLVTVLGYIDDDHEKVKNLVAKLSSPVPGMSREDLCRSLLFGSREQSYQRVKAFYENGVQSLCFWPIQNYANQIELFTKEILRYF